MFPFFLLFPLLFFFPEVFSSFCFCYFFFIFSFLLPPVMSESGTDDCTNLSSAKRAAYSGPGRAVGPEKARVNIARRISSACPAACGWRCSFAYWVACMSLRVESTKNENIYIQV